MTDTLKVWQCIGCGRIEAPQNCIGICQDRKVELVYAGDHEAALACLAAMTVQRDAMAALVRRLAHTRPRDGEWERTLRAFQLQARKALAGT